MPDRVDLWVDKTEALYDRLNRLLLLDDLAWRFRALVIQNKALKNTPPEFLDVFWDGYVHQAASAVRALADRDDRNQSYAVLLDDMLRHYDVLATHSGVGLVPAMSVVRGWGVELQSVVQPVRKYVNTEIAHFGQKPKPLRYLQLRQATYALGRLHQRLEYTLKASHLDGPRATRQYDWTAPLRIPWFPDDIDWQALEAADLEAVAKDEGWEAKHPYP